MLCRAYNIAQSLAGALQPSLTSTEQLLRGPKQSASNWLPFSSNPHAAGRGDHAVRHGLVLPSVWQYHRLCEPARLPHQLSGSWLVILDGLLPV